jgi:hypothetical protein
MMFKPAATVPCQHGAPPFRPTLTVPTTVLTRLSSPPTAVHDESGVPGRIDRQLPTY